MSASTPFFVAAALCLLNIGYVHWLSGGLEVGTPAVDRPMAVILCSLIGSVVLGLIGLGVLIGESL